MGEETRVDGLGWDTWKKRTTWKI